MTAYIRPASWEIQGGSTFQAALMLGQGLSEKSIEERRGDERMNV